ncbi:MAG: glycosyl hydrolase 53 family protein [Lachnospiraceae bacterium]|nr:glycosyl hydrolase 53 family protein [Lachnospiraceae bacterium]
MRYFKGIDLSTLDEMEKLGACYYDNGQKKDILEIVSSYDVDTIRIRIWNDPKSTDGKSYGAGNNDPDTSLKIAKEVTEAGLGVLLNFHYSDFWADPGKQIKPKAWMDLDKEELAKAVYDFTCNELMRYRDANVRVNMIQIGNELTNGLLWPDGKTPSYKNIRDFVSAGLKAAHSIFPSVPLMIHLDNGGNNELYRTWFDNYFANDGAPFDVIGMSYYPFWHGSLEELSFNMKDIAERYGKDIVIAEVSMGFTMEDYASYEKLPANERKGYATKPSLAEKVEYPMTKQGQADFTLDLLNRIKAVPDKKGRGFFWWEGGWIPVPGSGWATQASLEYMNDPGPCGNEWANQALFDYDGNVLPALRVIRDFKP